MSIKSVLTSVAALAFLILSAESSQASPLALVWDGPGTCKPACGAAAAKVARKAGFRVQNVYPGMIDFSVFNEATLWVQPGGVASTASAAMGPELLSHVREFIKNGGGFVGFCAGAFIATTLVGQTENEGYGLIPGQTELFIKEGQDHKMLTVTTLDGDREMYFAGGPHFIVTEEELKSVQGEITARYADGRVAGLQAHFGKGKVSVSGFHPEAGWLWKLSRGQIDRDGSDQYYAIDMINYATSQ
jgi:glutamine amidotransferase-like uncharacterized protein